MIIQVTRRPVENGPANRFGGKGGCGETAQDAEGNAQGPAYRFRRRSTRYARCWEIAERRAT